MGQPGVETADDKYARYDRDLERGREYEDFVYTLLGRHLGLVVVPYLSALFQDKVGENSAGIEIKFNDMFDETDNLWIELWRKSHPGQKEYKQSGIMRDDNGWLFITGTRKLVFIFTRVMLRGLRGKYTEIENKTKTSKGFLLSHADANKYAAFVIVPRHDDPAP